MKTKNRKIVCPKGMTPKNWETMKGYGEKAKKLTPEQSKALVESHKSFSQSLQRSSRNNHTVLRTAYRRV
jgi:hypothetical protein